MIIDDPYLASSMIIYKINVFLMAICNLFKKLSNNTGEFLMFSQYAEDLTRNNSQGYRYRVVPNRFIAANIDFSKFKYSVTGDLNVDFPTYLQNYFENGCALCKNLEDVEWDPTVSSNIFWNAMIEGGLINIKKVNELDETVKDYYVEEFKYVNDINIQSYDEVGGMGYSEIYCYIPNEAKEYHYGCSELVELPAVTTANMFVEGYKDTDKTDNILSLDITPEHKYFINKQLSFYFENNELYLGDVVSDKYDINCIIILYNINSCDESGNNVCIYENIPLGLYLPGTFNETVVNNIITKHIHNEDIFNSGTSYGIRICSRFSVSPNTEFIKSVDINNVSSSEYSSLCQVMGGISDNLVAMKNVVNSSIADSETLKDTLAIFKNSRTNVPYPIDINGTKYWYVNGRNTGIAIPDGDIIYSAYENGEITKALIEEDGVENRLIMNVYVIDENGEPTYIEKLKPTGLQDDTEIPIMWYIEDLGEVYSHGDIKDIIEKLYLIYPDGTRCEYSEEEFKVSDILKFITNTDGIYTVEAVINLGTAEEADYKSVIGTLDFKFCLPIFFGIVSGSLDEKGKDPNEHLINNLITGSTTIEHVCERKIYPSQYNKIGFKSNGGRIVYAYPASYEKLEKILNLNSMDDCIDDFTVDREPYMIKVNFPTTGEQIDYYLYCTDEPTGAGIEAEFEFTTKERLINNTFKYTK